MSAYYFKFDTHDGTRVFRTLGETAGDAYSAALDELSRLWLVPIALVDFYPEDQSNV